MKKILTLTFLLLILFGSSSNAQCLIPNASFETWDISPIGSSPTPWIGIGATKVTPGHTGTSAVRLTPAFGGIGLLSTNFPCTIKSNYLNGYIKGSFTSVDSAFVTVTFSKFTGGSQEARAIGVGSTRQNFGTYTAFHIPMTTISNLDMDTATITMFFQGSGANAYVEFDDLALSNTPIGINLSLITEVNEQLKTGSIVVFPNPSSQDQNIRINHPKAENRNGTIVSVYDLNSKLVYSKVLTDGDDVLVEKGQLSSGLYLLQMVIDHQPFTQKISID